MAEALYRKYRPQIFEDVVGQEHIERTLKNAIRSDKVSHAYLFTGPRGTGKTTTARLLAKALLCQHGPTPDPDGTCEDCLLIAEGEHPDVYELDAASRTGVENVREEIIGRVNYAPTRGRYKVYIIDEVHMLSTAAFNALLKTLEEPPNHVVFVLCTTDPQKVPETIHSRCQRFDFRRISNEELVSRLGAICEMEGIEYEGDALDLIAHRAGGGMRDALTSLEQVIAFGEGKVTIAQAERLLGSLDSSELAEIVQAIGKRDIAACFRWTSEYMESGADLAQFTQDLAEHMRNMYVMSLAGADVALEITESARRELQAESAWFGSERLVNLLGVLGDLSGELKTSTNQRLTFEIALTRMVRPDSDLTLASLAERIEALEAGYSATPTQAMPAVVQNTTQGNAVSAASAGHPARENGTQSKSEGSGEAHSAIMDGGIGATPISDAASNNGVASEVAADNIKSAGESATGYVSEASASISADSSLQAAQTAQATSEVQPAQVTQSQQAAQSAVQEAQAAQATQTTQLAQPTQSQSTFNPAAFGQIWETALAHLKKKSAAYGVIMMNARASYDASANQVTITFDAENEFAFNAAQKPEVREALSESLAKAGVSGAPLAFIKGGAASAAKPAKPAQANQFDALQPAQQHAQQQHSAVQPTQSTQSAQTQPEARGPVHHNATIDAVSGPTPMEDSTTPAEQPIASMTPMAPMESESGSFGSPESPYPEDDDLVPLSVYDDIPLPADDVQEDFSQFTSQPALQPTDSAESSSVEPSQDDLNSALIAGFGEGVSFELED